MADSSPLSDWFDVPLGEHELAFLRSEWERLAKLSEDMVACFAVIEKRLASSDSCFDAMDRRFN